MKYLPHFTFLRSFEAAARHKSFTHAAKELNCTQAAVSNHVRSLEDFLGRTLFVRTTRSLVLTEAGKAYLPSIRASIEEINAATELLVGKPNARTVVVSCPVSLAASWMPGLIARFHELHPKIELEVHGIIWSEDDDLVSDISITMEDSHETKSSAHKLWQEEISLVCAPDYNAGGEPLSRVEQLLECRLLVALSRYAFWERLAVALQYDASRIMGIVQTNVNSLALEMATSRLGCAVTPRSVAAPYIERGLLIEPFDISVECPWSFFARCDYSAASPSTKTFWNWLVEEHQCNP
ncbi:LysR substrate-binding domain-containing protein [Ruegeria jejuensis]|uniref:LysR substrate-binding domain-containing protein n=1 Tax=Ruegeria jejuensis TaxID=3233338 RepID=UPI00355BDE2C